MKINMFFSNDIDYGLKMPYLIVSKDLMSQGSISELPTFSLRPQELISIVIDYMHIFALAV